MSNNVKQMNKKKSGGAPHATTSFAQAMSNGQLNALKPYIQEQIGLVSQQIAQSLYQAILQERAMTQTRQLAFENLLKANAPWFNDEVLALAVADVEDTAANLSTVTTEVEAGDKVRIEFSAKPYDKGDWSSPSKLAIHSVTAKGPSGDVQTNPDLEANLVGLKTGDEKEFLIPEAVKPGEEQEYTRVKVNVIKVSRPVTAAVEVAQ